MKSSINVRYNVYAPKAERNRATHLNRARIVYRSDQSQTAARYSQMRLGHASINSAGEIQKRLHSAMNTNDSDLN